MAKIIPFSGLRYSTEKIKNLAEVTTPPYDVISPAAQDRYYAMNEYSIIRMELGKDLPGDVEGTGMNNKYTRAGEYMKKWMDQGILVKENKPSLYIYDQEFALKNGEKKVRRGLYCLVKLVDFSERIVLPHEETLSKAKTDRFNLMTATYSNISQIFSLYNDSDKSIIGAMNGFAAGNAPIIDFVDDDSITEKMWAVQDEAIISKIQDAMSSKQLFIADGHHRYETALNFRNKMAAENPNHTGNEPYNYVMMVLVEMDDPGLVVFPTHRVVKNLEGFNPDSFLADLKDTFEIEKVSACCCCCGSTGQQMEKMLEEKGASETVFGFYANGSDSSSYYLLTLKDKNAMAAALPNKAQSYRSLDVSILHTLILEKYFGINAVNMANQKNLSYTRDSEEAVEWVKSGEYQCSFLLNSTKVHQIKDVSLDNEKMPQKSTYFYPKLLTGLVMHKF